MTEGAAQQARRALHVLADLSSTSAGRASPGSIPLDWFQWLPAEHVTVLTEGVLSGASPAVGVGGHRASPLLAGVPEPRGIDIDRRFGDRLAAIDLLRPGQRSLRVGWLFVAGTTTTDDGRTRHWFMPLVTRPVRVVQAALLGSAFLEPAGDVELTPLIDDREARGRLGQQIELGGGALDGISGVGIPEGLLARLHRLQTFALEAAAAARLDATRVIPATDSPDRLRRADDLAVVAGLAVFANDEAAGLSHAASLRQWANDRLDHWTAFHASYCSDPPVLARPAVHPVESPFLLTPVQRSAVERSRTEPLTVIRGAPGTGKSHTIVAIACEALARNETVLVAARSEAAVDALIDLFERAPGPHPVVFGSNERKDALVSHLTGGLVGADPNAVGNAAGRWEVARQIRDELRRSIGERLQAELVSPRPDQVERARTRWPAIFDPSFDLDEARRLVAEAGAPARGWWARRRTRKAAAELAARANAARDAEPGELAAALDLVDAARVAARTEAGGGLRIGGDWSDLLTADDQARDLQATWLELECRSSRRLYRSTTTAVAALATALRSGRAARREQLSHMHDQVVTALPLWTGTLADIDDLLPAEAALFDVVILDEASSIDQPTAAAALLRGRRGVIVGDPQQLRHVSFLADEQRDQAWERAGVAPGSDLAIRLDVRRNSAFDVAAASWPIITLDEHFRCRPHLVDFVARRLYHGDVRVATRSPATDGVDCVDLERVAGSRDGDGVVAAEVEAVIAHLRTLRAQGAASVGVVSPFRAQADALERAILAELTADQIDALDLRVGTVHAFQGNERDHVIASLAVGPDDPRSWPFVEDPHLFTVLVTRARERFRIIYSADPPAGGLAAAYFAQADDPPGSPAPSPCLDSWTRDVDRHLEAAGLRTICTYPTGRHEVDICVLGPDSFFGVECAVHPDGPDAHIDRHLSLVRRGWTLREGYRSRWGGRRGELIVELTQPSPTD